VVVNYASSKEGADKVVAEIKAAGGKAVAVGGDVSKEAEAQGIIDAAIKNFGKLDVLVNNSGVYGFGSIEEVTAESFHKHFNINVLGLLLVTQAAVKHIGAGGSIINIGSVISRLKPAGTVVYTATKGSCRCGDGRVIEGAWREEDPRELDQPRPGRDRRHTRCGRDEVRLRDGHGFADSAGPGWRAGGYRQGCSVFGIGGFGMDYWRDAWSWWRAVIVFGCWFVF